MNDQLRLVLKDAYPNEVAILGEELVTELIMSQSAPNHLNLGGDDKFDLSPVYDFLKVASKVIEKIIDNYKKRIVTESSIDLTFIAADCEIVMTTADPKIKAEVLANLPRLIAIVESRIVSKPAT